MAKEAERITTYPEEEGGGIKKLKGKSLYLDRTLSFQHLHFQMYLPYLSLIITFENWQSLFPSLRRAWDLERGRPSRRPTDQEVSDRGVPSNPHGPWHCAHRAVTLCRPDEHWPEDLEIANLLTDSRLHFTDLNYRFTLKARQEGQQ